MLRIGSEGSRSVLGLIITAPGICKRLVHKDHIWKQTMKEDEPPMEFLDDSSSSEDPHAPLQRRISADIQSTFKSIDNRINKQLNLPQLPRSAKIRGGDLQTQISQHIGGDIRNITGDYIEPPAKEFSKPSDFDDLPTNNRRQNIIDSIQKGNLYQDFKSEKKMSAKLKESQQERMNKHREMRNLQYRLHQAKERINIENKIDKERRELEAIMRNRKGITQDTTKGAQNQMLEQPPTASDEQPKRSKNIKKDTEKEKTRETLPHKAFYRVRTASVPPEVIHTVERSLEIKKTLRHVGLFLMEVQWQRFTDENQKFISRLHTKLVEDNMMADMKE